MPGDRVTPIPTTFATAPGRCSWLAYLSVTRHSDRPLAERISRRKNFGAEQGGAVKNYLERVNGVLLRLPLVVTEAGIQEWLARLEDLERE